MRLRPRHVRTRLTLWYLALFGGLLLAYMSCVSLLQFWQLTAQLYHGAIEDLETAEGLLYFGSNGQILMNEEYHNRPESLLLLDRMMEVLAPDGTVLYRNDKLGNRDLGGIILPGEGETTDSARTYSERTSRLSDGTRVLLVSHMHSINGRPLLIRLGYDLAPLDRRMLQFGGVLLLALPLALGLAGLAGFSITRRTLTPLEEMARRTEQITASSLHDRLPIENPDDELGYVSRVLNGLLARLEASFEHLRRFTSDASHELRTPLAALQSVGEMGVQGSYSVVEYRDIIGNMLEEVNRMTRTVDSLMAISRADAGQVRLQISDFNVSELVKEAVALVDILAEEKSQIFTIVGEGNIFVRADRFILRQAIVNILHNAIKYSPSRDVIVISILHESKTRVVVEIIDHGPGIGEEHQAKIFDRFYRVDEGRTREAGGAGLGLAIAKWAVEIHSGQIGVRNNQNGGSCFYIRIPVLSAEIVHGGD